MDVFITKKAHRSISSIVKYIAGEGYPETAISFANRLYDFIVSLGEYPYKYQICTNTLLSTKQIRCAVYKNYICLYKIYDAQVIILNIVHSKRIK